MQYRDQIIEKPTFNVSEPFLGVTTIQVNNAMVELLIATLNSQGGTLPKEVWAFLRALDDPAGCREARQFKKRFRPKRSYQEPIQQDYDYEHHENAQEMNDEEY